MASKRRRRIAVIDKETDPFLKDRIPIPFAWGFYVANNDGSNAQYVHHWQEHAWESPLACSNILCDFLEDTEEELLIYAHNGGKFDFLFMIHRLNGKVRIVNGRILQAELAHQTLRDSYAIMPIPLSQLGDKLEIDYRLMEREVREHHKDEILKYLKADCIELWKAVVGFHERFGDHLTIGSCAMKQLQKFHAFEEANKAFDTDMRKFYFGGRCQVFEADEIILPVKGYDINSSYSDTMQRLLHPVSTRIHRRGKISKYTTAFVVWEGENFNAVPTRTKDGLDFTIPNGTFYTSIHEWEAGLETGRINPHRILEVIDFDQRVTFDDFVNHHYGERMESRAQGNEFGVTLEKLVLNAPCGKFAQDPETHEDSIILPFGDIPELLYDSAGKLKRKEDQFQLRHTHAKYSIWCKPAMRKSYFNVATAASITGGARATLLRGLHAADRPLYCDTDSIFCAGMGSSAIIDSKKLGGWKHEFTGNAIAIAGKKLYTVQGTLRDNLSMIAKAQKKLLPWETLDIDAEICLKKASKGTSLNPIAILMIAKGDIVETFNDAPAFKLDGNHQFIQRKIRRTTKVD